MEKRSFWLTDLGTQKGTTFSHLGHRTTDPTCLGNILCLCPNHHALCDMGAIEIIMSKLRPAVGHAVDQQYIDYHNNIYHGAKKGGA